MYHILEDYFKRKDYFVIVDQFSLFNPEITSDIVDVVAVNWAHENLLDAIAVECKMEKEPKISALASIQQAIEYQICFPKVYVATQEGDIKYAKTFFELNGVGHLAIDSSSTDVIDKLAPKKSVLFDKSVFNLNIKDRLIIVLVFRDIFGKDNFRYGEMNTHGWAAKDFRSNVQLNCCYDPDDGIVSSGLNLERKQGFRSLHKKFNTTEFHESLKDLPDDYILGVCIDLWPRGEGEWIFQNRQANKVSKKDLDIIVNGIKAVLMRNRATERPHMWISHDVWSNKHCLSRDEYASKIKTTLVELQPIFTCLGVM